MRLASLIDAGTAHTHECDACARVRARVFGAGARARERAQTVVGCGRGRLPVAYVCDETATRARVEL